MNNSWRSREESSCALLLRSANADQAVAIDLTSVITLANEWRAALAEKGLIKGIA